MSKHGSSGHVRSPNDQRSDAFNPTSHEYWARMNHHADQSNPTSETHQKMLNDRSRQKNPQDEKFGG